MDFSTVSRVVAEGLTHLPNETRQQILDTIEVGLEKVLEVTEAIEDALAPQANKPGSIYDEVRNDVGDPPGSFEDIVNNAWEYPVSNAAEQPDAESGGSENNTLDNVLNVVYNYLIENNDDWKGAVGKPDYIRQDNIRYPEFMLSALQEEADTRNKYRGV